MRVTSSVLILRHSSARAPPVLNLAFTVVTVAVFVALHWLRDSLPTRGEVAPLVVLFLLGLVAAELWRCYIR